MVKSGTMPVDGNGTSWKGERDERDEWDEWDEWVMKITLSHKS